MCAFLGVIHFRAHKSVDVLYLNVQGKNLISAIDATELKKYIILLASTVSSDNLFHYISPGAPAQNQSQPN